MALRDSAWRELYNQVVEAYWKGRTPGPSAYLSALWDEASYEELEKQLQKLKDMQS